MISEIIKKIVFYTLFVLGIMHPGVLTTAERKKAKIVEQADIACPCKSCWPNIFFPCKHPYTPQEQVLAQALIESPLPLSISNMVLGYYVCPEEVKDNVLDMDDIYSHDGVSLVTFDTSELGVKLWKTQTGAFMGKPMSGDDSYPYKLLVDLRDVKFDPADVKIAQQTSLDQPASMISLCNRFRVTLGEYESASYPRYCRSRIKRQYHLPTAQRVLDLITALLIQNSSSSQNSASGDADLCQKCVIS